MSGDADGSDSQASVERPRFLHRASEYGYTSASRLALAGAGEAVSADEQEHLVEQARQRARDRDRAAWQDSRRRLQRELDYLYSQRFRLDVSSQLRALERQIMRLDEKLGRRG